MSRFQLIADRRRVVAGTMYVHVLLKALRGDDWSTVGIFQLTEDEWIELALLCAQLEIPVIHGESIPA
jgi:hypothetical protein